jgi:hypothetical protein
VAGLRARSAKPAVVGGRHKLEAGPRADPRAAHADQGLRGPVAEVLLCTDGLASSYAKQALLLFREALRAGRVGRPRLLLPDGVMVARVKKRYARRRVVEVVREVVRGAEAVVAARIAATQQSASRRPHQHRLHRASERYLSRPAGPAGQEDTLGRSPAGDA